MIEEKKTEIVHPLLTREMRPIRNWHEWLEHWNKADNFQWMESLLHTGFGVPIEKSAYGEKEYGIIDRYIFYFSIADNWNDSWMFRYHKSEEIEYSVGQNPNGTMAKKTASELRQRLALKAFDMLCLNLFKAELKTEYRVVPEFTYTWERVIMSEQLLPVIMNFFRPKKSEFDVRVDILNLPNRNNQKSHNEQQAIQFLLNMAKFLWELKTPGRYLRQTDEEYKKWSVETLVRLDKSKPWMIEVLAELGKLDVLSRWILELDKACLAKLKEIAMRNRVFGVREPGEKEDRLVSTLDEACYLGSKAAWLLKEHELKLREKKRLNAIAEAEQKKAEADRKLKELRGS